MPRVILYPAYAICRAIVDLTRGNRSEVRFRYVTSEERRFGGQQKEIALNFFFLRSQLRRDRRFSRVEMGQKLRGDRVFRLCGFRSGAYLFLQTILSFLQRRQIGEHQFGIDYFNVTNRVNSSADVMNIGILKATDDLYNRVYLANMTEELIAETFAHARAFDRSEERRVGK